MEPFAIMHDSPQPARPLRTVEEPDYRIDAIRSAIEQAAMEQMDAGEEVRGDLALAATVRLSRRVEKIIAGAFISYRCHGWL